MGKLTENECKKCWILRFCKMCINHCTDVLSGEMSRTKKQIFCNSQKKSVELFLKKCIEIKNKDEI